MKQIVLAALTVILSLPLHTAKAQNLVSTPLLEEQVIVMIPDVLHADKDNPDDVHSFAAYTDQDRSLRFSYIVYGKIKDSSKIEDNVSSMEHEFVTRIPYHKLVDKGVADVNGHKVAYFEVENTDENQPYKHNLIFATDVNGELVAFVYSAASQYANWKATATQVMQSLNINVQ